MKKKLCLLLAMLILMSLIAACDFGANDSAPSNTMPVSNGEWDRIEVYGGGYFIVSRRVETFDASRTEFGVVDENGNWIHSFSANHIFHDAVFARFTVGSLRYLYLGDGMFAATTALRLIRPDGTSGILGQNPHPDATSIVSIYNVNTNSGFSFRAANMTTQFVDGYLLANSQARQNANIFKVDMQGNVTEVLSRGGRFGPYSEGLFWGRNSGNFYNIHGQRMIILEQYDVQEESPLPFFENRTDYIVIRNPGGRLFRVEIDTSGEFLDEPVQVR